GNRGFRAAVSRRADRHVGAWHQRWPLPVRRARRTIAAQPCVVVVGTGDVTDRDQPRAASDPSQSLKRTPQPQLRITIRAVGLDVRNPLRATAPREAGTGHWT